jgi:hypothetical protein
VVLVGFGCVFGEKIDANANEFSAKFHEKDQQIPTKNGTEIGCVFGENSVKIPTKIPAKPDENPGKSPTKIPAKARRKSDENPGKSPTKIPAKSRQKSPIRSFSQRIRMGPPLPHEGAIYSATRKNPTRLVAFSKRIADHLP